MAAKELAGRAWDVVGLGTVAVLGVLGIVRRHRSDGEAELQSSSAGAAALALDAADAHCIVTGASSGIGREVAWGLAKAGARRVELACRDLERCEAARSQLLERCLAEEVSAADVAVAEGRTTAASAAAERARRRRRCTELQRRCVCAQLELTDPASIRRFAATSALRRSAVDDREAERPRVVLVNNAGVMGDALDGPEGEVPSSIDRQLWTNHYGHFLLTNLLVPLMGPGSCVAVVASRAHRQGALRIARGGAEARNSGAAGAGEVSSSAADEAAGGTGALTSTLLASLGQGWYVRYARSKLCNVLFAAEFRRRYPDGPACVAVSPGLVDTGLFASCPRWVGWLTGVLAGPPLHLFGSPSEGAAHVLTAVAAALDSSKLEGARSAAAAGDEVLPLYWHLGRPERASAAAEDAEIAAALWRASEAATAVAA
eukprot:TRINITY_DN75510_c0_g1_i1.p1 TRINITY_DN75510_c0_g1~~TRINITY_DN75510_c0_g1_i1.p1  ORF type:complete len:441 (+),score=99.53 TRINITY_DN75510_c0_g1_i1:31-1323(+)